MQIIIYKLSNMNETFTVDSMIKEIKKNLDKYDKRLKGYETYQSQKSYAEIISLQKTIEKNIGMVKPIATKEEHKYLLNSYRELHTELNTRLSQTRKKLKQKEERENANKLFSDNQNGMIRNTDNLKLLSEENQILRGIIKMSNESMSNLDLGSDSIDDQERKLSKSSDQNIKINKKVPMIELILGKIKCHYIKEKIILGIVIGSIMVLGIYLTFYR